MNDLERARATLARVAAMHEERSAALEATGLTGFCERYDWLVLHPITEWLDRPDALAQLVAEVRAAKAAGYRIPRRNRSVPKTKRVPRFTDRQLEIATAALKTRSVA
jgi:hypothetical protein